MAATEHDHRLAAELAAEAGSLLLGLRAELTADHVDAATLKAEGDRRSHEYLLGRLAEAAPDDVVLSEEGSDDHARLTATRVWIIDPLDGTREFGEPPRADWAVHVALVEAGRPIAGAVALPAQRLVLGSAPPPPFPPDPPERPRVIVSRSRPPAVASYLAEVLGGDLVHMGSAGAKASAVILGAADVYAHAGGQYEWDSCAPVAVALATGLHASRLDGSPLTYNHPDPYLPDLLICHPVLAERALTAIARYEP
jgi:3'(2'), 5'-bisphosphate nucleotidase